MKLFFVQIFQIVSSLKIVHYGTKFQLKNEFEKLDDIELHEQISNEIDAVVFEDDGSSKIDGIVRDMKTYDVPRLLIVSNSLFDYRKQHLDKLCDTEIDWLDVRIRNVVENKELDNVLITPIPTFNFISSNISRQNLAELCEIFLDPKCPYENECMFVQESKKTIDDVAFDIRFKEFRYSVYAFLLSFWLCDVIQTFIHQNQLRDFWE